MQKTEKNVKYIMFEFVGCQLISKKKQHKLGLFHQRSAHEVQYYVLGVN